jgi:hypothetical protein
MVSAYSVKRRMRGPITTITSGFWIAGIAAMSTGRTAVISITGNARSAKAGLLAYMREWPSLLSEWPNSATTQLPGPANRDDIGGMVRVSHAKGYLKCLTVQPKTRSLLLYAVALQLLWRAE